MPDLNTNAELLLNQFMAELHSVDPQMQPPLTDINHGEDVLATVEDSTLQKLFALGLTYIREAQRQKLEAAYEAGDSKAHAEKAAKMADYHAKALFGLFWLMSRERYSLWGSDTDQLTIRKGWKIVRVPEQEGPPEFLRKLFGG